MTQDYRFLTLQFMKNLIFPILLLIASFSYLEAQDALRSVTAHRLDKPNVLHLDGVLDEVEWLESDVASEFTVYEPDFGKPATQKTSARFCYTNYGLYIGLTMYDNSPDSIFRDLSIRDDMGNADWIGIVLSPSCDGQNGFLFQITAAGVQYDAKIINDEGDVAWDAVWFSKTSINQTEWVAEILIPWSAIRFPNNTHHEWDINIIREIRRYREQSTWQPVDKKRHGFLTQSGRLIGISDLKTPVRLALMPYASGYLQNMAGQGGFSYTFNAGLDLKYGIKNNYTLDITLIPDFGQVRSDDEIYNFSPHEVKYNENRPFFTEGTELFEKAGIFYSRRVGRKPVGYDDVSDSLEEGEIIRENPPESQLINATKLSGRNSKGFALGIFNAMTAEMHANIHDTINGTDRMVMTQPFANYNMIVIDQTLNNNSFVHLASTNLLRNNYLANVTAFSYMIKNRSQSLALSGDRIVSYRSSPGVRYDPGYQHNIQLSKINGNVRWHLSQSLTDAHFDPNDMGYLTINNQSELYGELAYYQFVPYRRMLNYYASIFGSYNTLRDMNSFTWANIGLKAITTYSNRLSIGTNIDVIPVKQYDYYEARTPGRVFVKPGGASFRFWSSPDYRKKFLVDMNLSGWKAFDTIQKGYSVGISPRIRLNSRSLVLMNFSLETDLFSTGFTDKINLNDSSVILFGTRRVNKYTISLNGYYLVSPLASFNVRIRHYWVTTNYDKFYLLQTSGYLTDVDYNRNHNFTVNIFNIDLSYSWNFAPGSYLNVVYKNALYTNKTGIVYDHYIKNLENIIDSPFLNSISLKVIYYIDYESVKKLKIQRLT